MNKRPWTKTERWAPFHTNGNMLSYPEFWLNGQNLVEWRDVSKPFHAKLRYDDYGKGRSAVIFYWKDKDGIQFPMFLSDFHAAFKSSLITNDYVDGAWLVVKKGANYGIQLQGVVPF